MKRVATMIVAAGSLLAVGVAAPTLADPPASKGNHFASGTDVRECNEDGSHTIAFDGPKLLWPPNHKYRTVTITATGHDEDMVELETEASSDQDDVGIGSGGPNHAMDVMPPMAMDMGTGSASVQHQLRGERAGPDMEGRTYTIEATATFSDDPNNPCEETFEVHVPHDMRNKKDL